MDIQSGQLKDIQNKYPFATKENSTIHTEAGNDNGETFNGRFLVKIIKHARKQIYAVFENGKFIKEK